MTANAFVAMVARIGKVQECCDSADTLSSLIGIARTIRKETAEAVDEDEATRL